MLPQKHRICALAILLFASVSLHAQQEEPAAPAKPSPVRERVPPPPPPPPPPPSHRDIFKVVEEMPEFPGCENVSDQQERKQCAQTKMLEYIYQQLQYPALARENKVQGMVVVSFVVKKDGTIDNIHLIRDIGAGCGTEAVRVVQSMNDNNIRWKPGVQRGQAVDVQFNLPVKFKLDQPVDMENAMDMETPITLGPPPSARKESREIFKVVEEMPRFPGCEEQSGQARETCSEQKLLLYIYDDLDYPQEARENGVEGIVVITFVVEPDGSLSDIKIIRGIGGGCAEAAARVFEKMNTEGIRWIPGKQRGVPVPVQYNMPIRFKL